MRLNWRLLKSPLMFAGAVTALMAYSFTFSALTHGPSCPFYLLTSMPCPGCGSTRAVLALGQGDVAAAVSYNLFGLILFTVGLFLWTRWTVRRARGQDVPVANFSKRFAITFAVVALLWTVFRWTPLYPGTPL